MFLGRRCGSISIASIVICGDDHRVDSNIFNCGCRWTCRPSTSIELFLHRVSFDYFSAFVSQVIFLSLLLFLQPFLVESEVGWWVGLGSISRALLPSRRLSRSLVSEESWPFHRHIFLKLELLGHDADFLLFFILVAHMIK